MVELVWDGKHDANGRRVAPLRLKLPFQTVETINESAQQRQLALDLYGAGRPPKWRNRLIWGDKKYVLPALLDEFAGQVDLIYIDPPFATGQDFSFQVKIGDERFTKEASVIEQKAYRDTWGRGYDGYLSWFYETTVFLYEFLKDTGSLYVHCDGVVNHFLRLVLDQVFGTENFRNEIVWQRFNFHADARRFGKVTDRLLFYSKSSHFKFIPQTRPYSEEYIGSKFVHVDEDGRRFRLDNLNPPKGRGPVYEFSGVTKAWRFSEEKMLQLQAEGRIYTGSRVPQLKRYLDELEGQAVHDLWNDISPVNSQARERVEYATQKPEALLERVMKASSCENDLVIDCFVGSGTTAVVAEKLNRRWIACDLGRFAIHTTRKRLLGIENVRPFVVQNLGKYERQAWQAAEFGDKAATVITQYRHFILDLYHARAIEGYTWLHGVKDGRMVHVGPVDSPISPNDVRQIAIEFHKAMGTGKDAPMVNTVDVLGWDFAFELNEVARQQAEQANIDMRFIRIPREVLEKQAVDQGDVRFFELAALSVDVVQKGREVTLKLADFTVPPDDVPEDVQRAISHWSQWIDYWAVDWHNHGDTFHNMWQAYRTRQDKSLQLQVAHKYAEPGEYTIMIKVIDILGNDTTKTVKVAIA